MVCLNSRQKATLCSLNGYVAIELLWDEVMSTLVPKFNHYCQCYTWLWLEGYSILVFVWVDPARTLIWNWRQRSRTGVEWSYRWSLRMYNQMNKLKEFASSFYAYIYYVNALYLRHWSANSPPQCQHSTFYETCTMHRCCIEVLQWFRQVLPILLIFFWWIVWNEKRNR